MKIEKSESDFAAKLKSASQPARGVDDRALKDAFANRLKQVASRPDVVPIEFDGNKIELRRGGTLLGGALKNGIRLMHVCGARTLCGTCRVVVESGVDNLTPMRGTEKFSLRWHLSVSPRTRLACQARVNGPVEVESVFPLCGDMPSARE
jgi:ferredoxin, 2Fe-2S